MSEETVTRAAVVTGGSRGIGRAVCVALAKQGCNLVVNYCHGEAAAQETAALCRAEGVDAVAVQADVSTAEGCKTLFDAAVNAFGRVDILVNNAGRQQYCESIDDLTTADFDATFKTNVYAPFWITKAALRHLKASSVIINTSSVQAVKPSPVLLDYAQTKACLAVFTKSLAKQLGPKGIRVNAVAPGPYWTVLQSSGGQPMEKVKEFGGDTPLGRPGQPVEIAPLYVTLASDECSFTSGQVWCSDGGDGVI